MSESSTATGAAGTLSRETAPYYDPTISYQENYDDGPFGLFAVTPYARPAERVTRVPWLGADLGLPFGIPAGPLLNAKFVAAAFRWGYNLCHYKTVRSRAWAAHPFPNILRLNADGAFDPAALPARLSGELFAGDGAVDPAEVAQLSITNSFGMPAQEPLVWQRDVALAREAAGEGQILAVSVVGTAIPGGTAADFAADYATTAALAAKAGAMVIEANLSCPNVGGHGLVCHDIAASAEVCARIKEALPDLPLLVKLGNYGPDEAGQRALAELVAALTPYVAGFAAINAVPFTVVDEAGEQALPGNGRFKAGVCGEAIRAMGLDVVGRLAALRAASGASYGIVGVGGVMAPADYFAYRAAGADVVQAATGPMWRPRLAHEIAALASSLG